MKKYIIGTIFGFVLATAASVNAEGVNRLIDQVVQGVFPVTVEGNPIGEAVVIDNKTYLPVREFGEAVGYTVSFTEDREVVLTKNVDTTIPVDPVVVPQPTIPTKTVAVQIEELKNKIADMNEHITSRKQILQANENSLRDPKIPKEEVQKIIDGIKAGITDNEKLIADYEAQITALEAQK